MTHPHRCCISFSCWRGRTRAGGHVPAVGPHRDGTTLRHRRGVLLDSDAPPLRGAVGCKCPLIQGAGRCSSNGGAPPSNRPMPSGATFGTERVTAGLSELEQWSCVSGMGPIRLLRRSAKRWIRSPGGSATQHRSPSDVPCRCESVVARDGEACESLFHAWIDWPAGTRHERHCRGPGQSTATAEHESDAPRTARPAVLWRLEVVQVHRHLTCHRAVGHDHSSAVIGPDGGVSQAQGFDFARPSLVSPRARSAPGRSAPPTPIRRTCPR